MTGETIQVEHLEGGLRAAFVNLPHFKTHSARLTINSGSMHESEDAYGAAHFLEHVTFQGTEDMPTEQDVHNYTEEKGINRNAMTSQLFTTYIADGYDLESVGFMVTQLALHPNLTDEALEGERKPIIDETNGYASSPYYYTSNVHNNAIWGDQYGRPITGSVEDVAAMTPEALRSFHQRHYQLGNAVLVICSPESVDRQREYAQSIANGFGVDQAKPSPVIVDLPEFNPGRLDASLQQVDLPLSAQTMININYVLPETKDPTELLSYSLLSSIFSKTTFNRLRREMALCYGGSAAWSRLADLSFGRDKNWAYMYASASLNGEDSITGLKAIKEDVLGKPLSEEVFDSVLVSLHRDADSVMESPPSQIAERVKSILSNSNRNEVSLEEVKEFARTVSLDSIRKLQADMLDTKPLVIATSPDSKVLEDIGEWAAS